MTTREGEEARRKESMTQRRETPQTKEPIQRNKKRKQEIIRKTRRKTKKELKLRRRERNGKHPDHIKESKDNHTVMHTSRIQA